MTALEIVKAYYECFNRQDWEGMIACLDENVRHDANQGESHYGHEYYRKFLAHMDKCYAETLKDMVFMTEPGDHRVAVEFVVHGVYKATDGDLPPASGQQYILPAGAFLEVKNGKIARVTTYYNLPYWLKMVSGE